MCNQSCLDLSLKNLREDEVRGKSIIEVGALDVNGSLRQSIERFCPSHYVGVDIEMGPAVDQICAVEDLIKVFGSRSFDIVICTELLEHVRNWAETIHNLKNILKPGGIIVITTRSIGFDYHGFPYDFWRYERSDMRHIFSDFDIEVLEADPSAPGLFLKAKMPSNFEEKRVDGYKLYSIIQNRRSSIALNGFYWRIVCLPLVKVSRRKEFVARIMFYNAFPSKIPGLVFNKIKNVLLRTAQTDKKVVL